MSWESVKLVDVCDFQGGTQPPKSEWSSVDKDGFVRMIQIRDFTQGKDRYIEYVKDSTKLKKCFSTDIMIGRYGASIGKILTGLEGAYNVALVKTIPSNQLNKRYFYHYLNTPYFQNFIQNAGSRAAQAGFNKEELKELQIPLPPLPVQKQIAAILDAADALRRKDQELLKKYDELGEAIFIDMFGDPVRNEKGWDCLIGKEYANRISVGVVIKPASYYVNEGIPALRSQNVRPNRITKDNLVYFSEETNEKVLYKSKIFTGDVLIVRTGQPGTAAVVEADINGINCIDMLIVSPKKDIVSPYYLAFFLNSDAGKNYIASNQKGQIQQHFNVGDINSFRIPIPPISLQLKFEYILLNLKGQLSKDLTYNSESLFQSLLQKAFKGEL